MGKHPDLILRHRIILFLQPQLPQLQPTLYLTDSEIISAKQPPADHRGDFIQRTTSHLHKCVCSPAGS